MSWYMLCAKGPSPVGEGDDISSDYKNNPTETEQISQAEQYSL